MKKLILIVLLLPLLSGCIFSKKDCDSYCDGDVAHTCEDNSSGMWSGSAEWYSHDCSEKGMVCVEIPHPLCVDHSEVCTSGMDSYCDGRKKVNCYESDGEFYEKEGDACSNNYGTETCEQFDNKAECVVRTNYCDTEAESVCVENHKAICFEKDGEYFAQFDDYDGCGQQDCVEIDGNAKCLTPVDSCFPYENNTCYENFVSDCYEKDGDYYVSKKEDCYDKTCVELGNVIAKCLYPSGECDLESYSACSSNTVMKCYRKGSQYFKEYLENCNKSDEDECIYDPETKSAHCLSAE